MPAVSNTVEVIARELGRNSAGVHGEFFWTNSDEIVSQTLTAHTISAFAMRAAVVGPPAVAAGKFFKVTASMKDASFETQEDENGVWKTTGKFFIPKQTAVKAGILNGKGEECNILVVRDLNGAQRIIGDLELPATVRIKETTSPKNGYELAYEWSSNHSPYFSSATLTV
jgi:hypothetical protein